MNTTSGNYLLAASSYMNFQTARRQSRLPIIHSVFLCIFCYDGEIREGGITPTQCANIRSEIARNAFILLARGLGLEALTDIKFKMEHCSSNSIPANALVVYFEISDPLWCKLPFYLVLYEFLGNVLGE